MGKPTVEFKNYAKPFERWGSSDIEDDPRFIKSPVRNEYGPAYVRQFEGRWLFGVACVLPFAEVEVTDEFALAWISEFG